MLLLAYSGFNPCFTGSTTSTGDCNSGHENSGDVSILVLLEVPLQLTTLIKYANIYISFNPCFTGSTTSTGGWASSISDEHFSFNPCFTGSTTSTGGNDWSCTNT